MSANEYLIDASTRHQIMLQRLSGGSFNKLKPILEKLQKDIRARLSNNPTEMDWFEKSENSNYSFYAHDYHRKRNDNHCRETHQ